MATEGDMKMRTAQRIGQWGETQALQYLETKGMRLVERNVRAGNGEIDLIMEDSSDLVFIEVKTRSSLQYGSAEESVTEMKKRRMYEAAASYLDQHDLHDVAWRLDVVTIQCTPDRRLIRLDHYANIAL